MRTIPTIGVVGTDLSPPFNEGIKNTVYELYRRIIREGFNILLITKGTSRQQHLCYTIDRSNGELRLCVIPVTKKGSTHTHLTGAYEFIMTLPVYLREIYRYSDNIEIFHIHTSFPAINSLIAFQVKTGFKTKTPRIIATQYSTATSPYLFGKTDLKYLFTPILTNPISLAYSFIDLIILLNRKACQNLKKYFARRVIWFPHVAIDTEKFKPDKKCRDHFRDYLSLDDETILLLYAGDLTPSRGLEFFISTIKYTLKKSKKYKVRGLIPLKDRDMKIDRYKYIVDLIRSSRVENYVEILGYREDIDHLINSSDIVIMPLRKDYGFMDIPRFLLEAMSCGKPVITSTVGAIDEVLYNWVNGILCEPENLECIITSLDLLIEDPILRHKIGANARRTVLEIFDADKICRTLLRIYYSLMER